MITLTIFRLVFIIFISVSFGACFFALILGNHDEGIWTEGYMAGREAMEDEIGLGRLKK